MISTPVLLTPRGGIITLSPLKNLLSAEHAARAASPSASSPGVPEPDPDDGEENIRDVSDRPGPDGRDEEQQDCEQLGQEIIVSLNTVCRTGQQMKFSLPGVSQAFSLNFSAEALQVLYICTYLEYITSTQVKFICLKLHFFYF